MFLSLNASDRGQKFSQRWECFCLSAPAARLLGQVRSKRISVSLLLTGPFLSICPCFCVSTDRILSIRLQSLSMRYAVFVVVVVCALPSTWALSPDQGLRAENWSHAHDFSSQASLHHGLTKPLRGRRRFLQSAEGEDLHSAATSAAENERWHRVAQKRAERRAERLARRNANASASCTMHTYFSPLSDATSEEIAASNTLVSKWREAWEAGGWSTRVINEDDAKNHPEYDVLKAAFTALPTVTSLH